MIQQQSTQHSMMPANPSVSFASYSVNASVVVSSSAFLLPGLAVATILSNTMISKMICCTPLVVPPLLGAVP